MSLHIGVEDKNGVITNSAIEIDTSSATNHPYARFNLGVGCENLNNATLSIGVQPVIDEDDRSYFIHLRETTPLVMSETYYFDIDQDCHNVERRFHWLNRLGGIDSFNFTANESLTQTTQHINYNKNLLYVPTQNASNTYDLDVKDRGITSLAVKSSEEIMTYSQIVDDQERIWLQVLLSSPNVWTEELDESGDRVYIPIILRDSEIMMSDEANNLFTFSFGFSYANKVIIQDN